MGDVYYLLYRAFGHNIYNSVEAESLQEVKEEILPGFESVSDTGKVKITTDLEVVREWEASCYHVRKESQ
jgi:hypothetical protein